jgi:hypothetical protein
MTVLRDKAVKDLVKVEIGHNAEGLIPEFNVLVNQLPTEFWDEFADRIIAAAPADRRDAIEAELVECAHESGYHTGHGIITSDEFKAIVTPMVTEGPKDILRGAYAVLTAWGWAKSGIVQIVEGERMTIRATDYYESDGHKSDHKLAFMIRGISTAFFELAYGRPYPDGMGAYQCEQVKGIECGDQFGEFIITGK